MRTRKPIGILVFGLCFLFVMGALRAPANDDSDEKVENPSPSKYYFARVRFTAYDAWGRNPGWAHDYPRAERNLLTILSDVSQIRTTRESYVIVDLADPAIMQYPLLYFSEPGTWDVTPEEARNFREYLDRGGFAIFDDFDGASDWYNFETAMKQVFPDRHLKELDLSHEVFHCFYDIKTLDMVPPYEVQGKPTFYGLSDEKGRLQAVANFNNDIGDFWEWSDEAWVPIALSNEAY